jgi:cytoskeletal protein RodZ
MLQKHIIISMIAPVAIAGILIMAMAAISSINQAFAVGEESNNTGNEATSHESNNTGNEATSHESKNTGNEATSHESNNTGTALSAQGEEQQSKNTGKKLTELTISATQTGPAKTEENNATGEIFTLVPVTLSGRLTSEGSGVAGASLEAANAEVRFHCDDSTCNGEERTNTGAHVTRASVTPDSGGHYSVVVLLGDHNHKTHKIDVTLEPSNPHEPSGYEKSHATTTIQLNKGSPEGKRTG